MYIIGTAQPLLVPDFAGLQRKLAIPPPLLARLYARFRARLASDPAFRRHHIFLPALLGEPAAIADAKALITTLAMHPLLLAQDQSPSSTATAQDSLNGHVWCVAPRAMRLAVYFTWLDVHGAWTPDERRTIGTAVLDFFHTYVVPVLRARTPGGHNQQFSMTFCSAVAGQAFAEVDGVATRARALRDWALPKFTQTLGLMPASGYSGEGSTYQSDVVSALAMWAGAFLEQLGETDVWHRRWQPNGACLADTLRLEAAMGSCGGLLPPWDHYGWVRIHNLAARSLWAGLSGEATLLPVAETAWDEASFIAWRPDDRLWTLLYWPAGQDGDRLAVISDRSEFPLRSPTGDHCSLITDHSPVLTGWSLPAVGVAIEHQPRQLRVMTVWDRCAGGLQGVCRGQVNPNHLMIDLGGEPITADGWEDGRARLVSDAALDRTLAELTPVERELLTQQYGSVEQWARNSQHGFLGQACAIIVDGWESYFPRHAREGVLLYEWCTAERHTVAGEAAAYYQPAFDVTRMRRTVSMGAAGVVWIVDDLRADSAHEFTWRLWLRRGIRQSGAQRVQLTLPSGAAITLAWLADGPVALTTVPTFPQGRGNRYPWPDEGSERCDLTAAGRQVQFVTCLVPATAVELAVRPCGPHAWEATWTGGGDRFELPAEILAAPDPTPVLGAQISETHTLCDLDETPFALLNEPDAELLAALDAPPAAEWRRTGAAMQTLLARGNPAALPKIVTLLLDAGQNYTVHSVAAWCLGHARYAPARAALQRMAQIPEDNTAARACWALARLG
jgi:hypothetical protein